MKLSKKAASIALALALVGSLTACDNKLISPADSTPTPAVNQGSDSTNNTFTGLKATLTEADKNTDATSGTQITLNGSSAEVSGSGASWSAGKLTISSEGTYIISGNLDNGCIYVNAENKAKVHIVLKGVNITNSRGPAIFIENADKTIITLAEGTTNVLTDGKSYTEGNACLFSKDDLTINGTGALEVNGNFNNGIGCKNDLKIVSGTIAIKAVTNGLKGNDSVSVFGGSISINAGKDGIKADTADTEGKGFVYIEAGNISITAADDGIQAETSLGVLGGSVTVNSTDKKYNCKTYCFTID